MYQLWYAVIDADIHPSLCHIEHIFLKNILILIKISQYHRTNIHLIDHHYDVIKWKHLTRYWAFVRRIHRSPVDPPPPLKKGPVTRSFGIFFDLRLNKHLRHRWLESPSRSLWRHCNDYLPCEKRQCSHHFSDNISKCNSKERHFITWFLTCRCIPFDIYRTPYVLIDIWRRAHQMFQWIDHHCFS